MEGQAAGPPRRTAANVRQGELEPPSPYQTSHGHRVGRQWLPSAPRPTFLWRESQELPGPGQAHGSVQLHHLAAAAARACRPGRGLAVVVVVVLLLGWWLGRRACSRARVLLLLLQQHPPIVHELGLRHAAAAGGVAGPVASLRALLNLPVPACRAAAGEELPPRPGPGLQPGLLNGLAVGVVEARPPRHVLLHAPSGRAPAGGCEACACLLLIAPSF